MASAVSAEPVQLEPLVVTGVPAPAPELDVPAAVSQVDAQDLREGQYRIDLSESLARVPGVTVRNRYNYAQDLQIQSRGFGARASFGVRGLQLRVDDLPATAPDGQGASAGFLVDALERIEVLRGPLAYAYGNSAGGVIAAYSESPPPGIRVRASGSYAEADTWRVGLGAAGSALGERIGYRLDGARFETTGTRPHSAAERTQASGSLGFKLGPQSLHLVFNGVSQPDAQDPLGLTRAQFDADPHSTDPVAIRFDTRKSVEERQAGLRWSFDGAQHDLQLMAYGTQREVEQYLSIPVAVQQASDTHAGGVVDLARDGVGAEARWTWSGETLRLGAGVQAQRTEEDRRGYENFVGAQLGVRGALRRDETNTLENLDPFVLAQWQPHADWTWAAAVRRSEVEFESADRFTRGTSNRDDSGRAAYHATTPAVGVSYALAPRSRLYASWGAGFETPTFNEISYRADGEAGLNLGLRAARSRTLEVGAKHAGPSGPRWSAALYETCTDDEIVPARNSGGRATFQNAERTRRLGAELGVEASLPGDLHVQLAADWIDAQFRTPFRSVSAGTAATVPAGNRIPGVARESLYGELAWRRGRPGWSAALELRATRKVMVNDTNTDAAGSGAAANLRAGWRGVFGWGEASVFARVDNLADRNYAGAVIVNEGNGRFFEPAPGRSAGAGLELVWKR